MTFPLIVSEYHHHHHIIWHRYTDIYAVQSILYVYERHRGDNIAIQEYSQLFISYFQETLSLSNVRPRGGVSRGDYSA